MKICLVTQGYGERVVGGSEALARSYAERLAADGHQVMVFTTSATNQTTWPRRSPRGTSFVNGVEVRRFPVTPKTDGYRMASLNRSFHSGLLSSELQWEWVMGTDYSDPLLDAIDRVADIVDVIVFTPYALASTVIGALIRPDRSVVIPCLHDEPFLRSEPHQLMLRSVRGLIFNTDAERQLANRVLGELPSSHVVGIGFDIPTRPDTAAARRRFQLPRNFVCYGGRKDSNKGIAALLRGIALFNLNRVEPLPLVMFGSGPWTPPKAANSFVRDLGNLDAWTRMNVLAASLVTGLMSRRESFSHLVMESWTCGVPVVVDAQCDVTRQHCERSGGGLWVAEPEELAEALRMLELDGSLRRRLGEAGREYVRSRYSWAAVMERLTAALSSLASSQP